MWPRAGGSDHIASVEQTSDFIASYQRAIEREWDASQVQDAWAASLWVGLVFAKQDAAEGGNDHIAHLTDEVEERLHRAGPD
jgi:hypothetical protein